MPIPGSPSGSPSISSSTSPSTSPFSSPLSSANSANYKRPSRINIVEQILAWKPLARKCGNDHYQEKQQKEHSFDVRLQDTMESLISFASLACSALLSEVSRTKLIHRNAKQKQTNHIWNSSINKPNAIRHLPFYQMFTRFFNILIPPLLLLAADLLRPLEFPT